jgi:hypothetical protein
MKFSELVDQAVEFLRRRARVSYRALKREFDLDDEALTVVHNTGERFYEAELYRIKRELLLMQEGKGKIDRLSD